MIYFIGWVILSFVVGALGTDRHVGFWGGLLCSLLLSPLIGLVIVGFSQRETQEQRKEEHAKRLIELGNAAFAMGNNQTAAYHYNEALANSINPSGELFLYIACSYARMGDKKVAFDYLEKAIIANVNIDKIIHSESFKPYRDDPEYLRLITRMTDKIRLEQNRSIADELIKLKTLLDNGVLTTDEFETQKRKLLS